MNENGSCGTCRFSTVMSQVGLEARYCRCAPPNLVLLPADPGLRIQRGPMNMNVAGLWPPVADDAWCGKFEPESTQ
jgi:hypothetical protein